ncbi:uncharacterized protein LOC123323022 [Coccinella septempunctata]|uniref:uncharacterized protein LOC123323022 n=1 Tax=Coccinella septempunctata TaxID=41139 RepID=UPI001D05E3DB|nr:uncharacterized protein LOC123323022 [Coccinella septempunctata]
MLKIRALNRDSLSDEDAPVLRKELQEEIALEIYNNALRLEGTREFEKSKELLFKLIENNIPQLENQGGLPKSMCTLKFACYLNLGHIFHEEKNNVKALEYYSIASELDQGDITLWYKIGKLSIEEHRFKQSIYAFSKGLDCYDSHWPCLDAIIPLLFAVKDTVNCLFYIGKALELDPEYMKGLVLRKRIYQDNPATREYYQALNPDYKWEPPLDVEINEGDEEKYLNEVQTIADIINEAEKNLEPKPLRTIPLPEALENYSWLALSKCITVLYEYLHSNEMSFLTFVDLDKCMSQTGSTQISHKKEENEKETVTPIENIMEIENNNTLEGKIDIDPEFKRRPSQNSEENGTPIQTDNDEEQQMEQDNEDQEERNDKSKTKSYKRKRDLLSDLRVWGWHSKRKNVRKTRPDKFYTVEDCLNQILPTDLLRNKIVDTYLQDESMNAADSKYDFLEDKHTDTNLLQDAALTNETYFGTNKEKEDILKLWNKVKEDCDITILVKEYVIELSKLWNIKWPETLITHYIFIHEKYSQFYQLSNIYDAENKFDDIKKEALSNLLYAELVLFRGTRNEENERFLHIGQIQFVEAAVALWEKNWEDEDYISIFLRIIWLRAYVSRKEKNYDTAVRYLELMMEKISEEENKNGEKFSLFLPNSSKCGNITSDGVEKILKHLHMIKSVSCLEELFDQAKYNEVAEIVVSTFESDSGYPTVGKIGRPTQLGMLLHSFWFTDFDKCFLWCEECLFESYPHYTKPGPNRPQWEAIVEKCLLMMLEIIKNKSRNIVDVLPDDKKARLTETLARIICKQIYTENSVKIPLNTVAPWLILHHLLVKYEQKNKPEEEFVENAVPASLSILFSAHEFLGPKSWCLTSHGELLHYILDILLDREDAYKYEKLREKLDIQIEQALFCLYQHPSKKNKISRHLADHNVDPLPLTWEKSFQLYEFYAPEVLPEFNSFKNASITVDLEQLLLRITALVTPECNPSISVPKINEYLRGHSNEIPDPIEFPYRIQAIYYLLGDYYFKLKDFVRCVDFFLMDLAINPKRVDSWACLALSYLNQLEIKLNFCKKMKSEEEFLEIAKYAQVAFTTALNLSPENITLWIEFASFEYMAHSFCSRYLGHESENMSMEKFTHLEDRKNAFLESSRQSFEKAIALYDTEGSEPDERWLHYYILGKIAEKKQSEPNEYLGYYITASQLLHENNATYPEKIAYNSPQHLSVEALELHYRMNASILKYLELHEGKEITHSIGALFKKSLDALPINRKLVAQKAQKKIRKSIESNNRLKKLEESENKGEEKEVTSTKTSVDECIEKDAEKENLDNLQSINLSVDKKNSDIEESVGIKRKRDDNDEEELDANPPNPPTPQLKEMAETSEQNEEKKEEKEVRVVDEVILLDSEYDVILILSSDDEEGNNTKRDKNEGDAKLEDSKDAKISQVKSDGETDKLLNTEGSSVDKNSTGSKQTSEPLKTNKEDVGNTETKNSSMQIQNDESTIINTTPHNISDQIASGMDVQLILDKMMQETMEITAQQPMEIDSDTTGQDKSLETLDSIKLQEQNKELENNKLCIVKEEDAEENKKSTEESSSSGSSSSSSDSSSTSDSDSDDDDTSSTTSSSSSDESSGENLSKNDITHLVDRCIKGLELCIIRLPKNYKAVYRLVHLFFHYKEKKDLNKCKQLLLGEYKCYENSAIIGLFSDRKNNNFFNGIWRIPSSEIDRPGSLSAHMIRCVTILLQILRTTGDFKILLDMHFQLKKNPDPDKIYIKDVERLQFSEQAISLSIQILRESIQNAEKQNTTTIKKLLQDIYKIYLRIQKYAPEKEMMFGNMLVDLYKMFIKEKIPDSVNVLELVTKFCQQMKITEKQQNLLTSQNMALQNPHSVMGPVLPSPSNVNPSSSSLKRPSGIGRPRGRPPLPKVPNQMKPPRNKTPSWKKLGEELPNSQDYLLHYKEELMKQYSQNLSFLQNAQFAQLYSNSFLASYMQTQQTNMLSTNFLQQLSSLGMTAGSSLDPLRMNLSQKQTEEMVEMLKNMSNLYKNQLNPKKSRSSNSSTDSPIATTSKQVDPFISASKKSEQSVKKLKFSMDQTDLILSNQSSRVESPSKKLKCQPQVDSNRKTDMSQLKKTDTAPSISIVPVTKEKNISGSCVSSISIIPKGDPQSKAESGEIIKTSICSNAMNLEQQKMTITPSVSIETAVKKAVLENSKPQSPLNIMPPPSPLMHSSISNFDNDGSISKQPSPRKSSPIGMKESSQICKLKNIEATISKVPHVESFKKLGKDRIASPSNTQMPNFAHEAGLLKFPPSLSMTPINTHLNPASEFQQSISLHKTPSIRTTETYLPKLPSSITLTPSQPKSTSASKNTCLEIHKKAYETPVATKDLQKHVNSSTCSKSAYSNKQISNIPNIIDLQVTKSYSADHSKSKGTSQVKKADPGALALPFNVDSMLQPSLKTKPTSSPLSYGFPQHLTSHVAHTSVITSTSMSGSTLDCNISSLFTQPNPMPIDNRCLLKSSQSFSKKSSTITRTTTPDSYKVDDQRSYDKLSSIYTSTRQDMTISKTPKGSTSVITSINKASTPLTYVSPQISPGKTLQEKLADKKREQASKHLFEQMGHKKPVITQTNKAEFNNPHSVSKILSRSTTSEPSASKIVHSNTHSILPSNHPTHGYSRSSEKTSSPRRKSSSDESVIFLD